MASASGSRQREAVSQTDDPLELLGQLIRFATVDSIDLASGKLRARMGDVVTGPIRWFHPAAGATRAWSPPSIGEQLLVFCPEGDIAGAIALRGVHSGAFPPAGTTTRELVQFADGAVLAYDPEAHKLEAVLPAGAIVSIVAPGGVTLQADVKIQGDLAVDGAISATGDVKAGSVSLANHLHTQVTAGQALSGKPQP